MIFLPKSDADIPLVQSLVDSIKDEISDMKISLPQIQQGDQVENIIVDEQEIREERIRLEDDVLDVAWFANLGWDKILDLKGTTFVQIPARHKFAIQQAQHAIIRAIEHANNTNVSAESAWKVLIVFLVAAS